MPGHGGDQEGVDVCRPDVVFDVVVAGEGLEEFERLDYHRFGLALIRQEGRGQLQAAVVGHLRRTRKHT